MAAIKVKRQPVTYSNNNNAIDRGKLAVIVCYDILNRNARTSSSLPAAAFFVTAYSTNS